MNNHCPPASRHYACPNEPAYREYLKRILEVGVEEVKAAPGGGRAATNLYCMLVIGR
jgi:hypothetical protein